MNNKTVNRALSVEEIDQFGAELDALRQRTLNDVGERDARYIRRVEKVTRYTEAAGRGLLFLSFFPPAWLLGTLLLGLSKILDNMELGHNLMHGQYDFMQDPHLNTRYEWDTVCPGDAWRHSHNYMHHTYTNVMGMDRDVGYSILRLFPEQRWELRFLGQPFYTLMLALFFDVGVGFHDLELDRARKGEKTWKQVGEEFRPVWQKMKRLLFKDYLLFPLLSGPLFLSVLAGNFVANLIRNVWSFTIIFCGHFTANAEVFPASVVENESRGHWYLRQLRGSSNLSGGKWFHILSGNLSHQIEHHLFPDLPACRYAEMAPVVRAICERHGQHYNTGSLGRQFAQVLGRIFRHSLPSRPAAPALAS